MCASPAVAPLYPLRRSASSAAFLQPFTSRPHDAPPRLRPARGGGRPPSARFPACGETGRTPPLPVGGALEGVPEDSRADLSPTSAASLRDHLSESSRSKSETTLSRAAGEPTSAPAWPEPAACDDASEDTLARPLRRLRGDAGWGTSATAVDVGASHDVSESRVDTDDGAKSPGDENSGGWGLYAEGQCFGGSSTDDDSTPDGRSSRSSRSARRSPRPCAMHDYPWH
jgi:hypothetical protein